MSYSVSQSFSVESAFAQDNLPPVRESRELVSEPQGPPKTPVVWYVYCCYCLLLAAGNFVLTVASAILALNAAEYAALPQNQGMDAGALEMLGWTGAGIGFLCASAFAIGPFSRQGGAGWVLGIVLIILGLLSVLTAPFSIFMLIAWFRPGTKAFFGMQTKSEYDRLRDEMAGLSS